MGDHAAATLNAVASNIILLWSKLWKQGIKANLCLCQFHTTIPAAFGILILTWPHLNFTLLITFTEWKMEFWHFCAWANVIYCFSVVISTKSLTFITSKAGETQELSLDVRNRTTCEVQVCTPTHSALFCMYIATLWEACSSPVTPPL